MIEIVPFVLLRIWNMPSCMGLTTVLSSQFVAVVTNINIYNIVIRFVGFRFLYLSIVS